VAPDAEILWQVGATDTTGLGITAHDRIPALELKQAIQNADLVVSHAGVGSALSALDAGRCPVLLPRSVAADEHVDDHQWLIADELADRGLAVRRAPGELVAADLDRARHTRVVTNESAFRFPLA
jgi:UDP-N-acetylglucosamine--N-acetylmuramyl-(pentapeptide) pyrophosphoryl-undecaprenol N-acetylglucosamine transferase